MQKFEYAGAQGEVNSYRIDAVPEGCTPVQAENGLLIVGHSESGHHHGFRDDGSVTLLERTKDVPAGMRILYAIIEAPSELMHDAGGAHEGLLHEPGIYELRISREYNPFLEEARRVKD